MTGLHLSACKHCGADVVFGRYGKRWVCLDPKPDARGRYEITDPTHPARLALLTSRQRDALWRRGGCTYAIHLYSCTERQKVKVIERAAEGDAA